ncbi:MAG: hypothetical protein KAJ30_07635 [Candidatus Heimdallarchaeota archaeon]|nr:hypothetical protein [Candidatus Omnitrophota bacterium]MCK5410121.1 hypothetical protein [Candidatus Heimdallarchaeota archaeon]
MKLLKIDNDLGHFLDKDGEFQPIDRITKEDLLNLVNSILSKEVDFDEYVEEKIKNQAHQIVYKSIHGKLRDLRDRKQEFIDESERAYLSDYEKYKDKIS